MDKLKNPNWLVFTDNQDFASISCFISYLVSYLIIFVIQFFPQRDID